MSGFTVLNDEKMLKMEEKSAQMMCSVLVVANGYDGGRRFDLRN
jgi:hypothetical protein